MRWSIVLATLCCALHAQAAPPNYSAQSVAEVIEIGTEKRSEGEVRKFKVHAFGEKVELNLKRSDGLLPKTLKVNVIDVDENGKQTMEDWSHETGMGSEVYTDMENSASVIIDDVNGPPQLRGRLRHDLIIEPSESQGTDKRGSDSDRTIQHKVYRIKPSAEPDLNQADIASVPGMDLIPSLNESLRHHEKRQMVNQIYVPMHIIINYDYFLLMGNNEQACIAYVKTYFASIYSYFNLIVKPRTTVSIQSIDIFKSQAASILVEQHRHKSGGLIGGDVIMTFTKWAFQNQQRLGDVAGIMIMTGTKTMCSQPHGVDLSDCQNIAGLAYGGAGCSPYGDPFPGQSWKTAIALDDYAYTGVIATTHEVGHLLGMSHDGDPGDYKGAPTSEQCNFDDAYIMGTQKYIKLHTKWSDCSLRQLQYWITTPKAKCTFKKPAPNQFAFSAMPTTVHTPQTQCQKRFGASYTFSPTCQSDAQFNDEICYNLKCMNTLTQQCKSGYGAGPGTKCGPSGEVCWQGACQNPAKLGITQPPPGPAGPVTQGPCIDKNVLLGNTMMGCSQWLPLNKDKCDDRAIKKNCCATRAQICPNTGTTGNTGNTGNIGNPGSTGCADTVGMSFSGKNCEQFLSSPGSSVACTWDVVNQHCCASKAKYCTGAATPNNPALPQNPINNNNLPNNNQPPNNPGCADTAGVSFSGKNCDQFLSANSFGCKWAIVEQHCCASKAKYCDKTAQPNNPINPHLPNTNQNNNLPNNNFPNNNLPNNQNTKPINPGCADTVGMSFSGKNCEQFLSSPGSSVACTWDVVNQHCCASKAKYCTGGATPNNPALPQNPINNNNLPNNNQPLNKPGCADTAGMSFSGKNCEQFLSSPGSSVACTWDVVNQHCCASQAKYCTGRATPNNPALPQFPTNPVGPQFPTNSVGPQFPTNPVGPQFPTNPVNPIGSTGSAGCTDSAGVKIGTQSCAQYLSVPTNSFACTWPVVIQHCCASKAQYCGGAGATANTGPFGK